jgi:hypothetical protein
MIFWPVAVSKFLRLHRRGYLLTRQDRLRTSRETHLPQMPSKRSFHIQHLWYTQVSNCPSVTDIHLPIILHNRLVLPCPTQCQQRTARMFTHHSHLVRFHRRESRPPSPYRPVGSSSHHGIQMYLGKIHAQMICRTMRRYVKILVSQRRL